MKDRKTIAYLDSSVLVSLMFAEISAKSWKKELDQYSEFVSSDLLSAEIYAAATRHGFDDKVAKPFIEFVNVIIPDRALQPELELIFNNNYLRGADAFHLASALWFLSPSRGKMHFLTSDKKQAAAAQELGFKTISFQANLLRFLCRGRTCSVNVIVQPVN